MDLERDPSAKLDDDFVAIELDTHIHRIAYLDARVQQRPNDIVPNEFLDLGIEHTHLLEMEKSDPSNAGRSTYLERLDGVYRKEQKLSTLRILCTKLDF